MGGGDVAEPAGKQLANNATKSGQPFFIAKYGGRAAAIRRDPDFKAAVDSICKAFSALKLLDSSLVRVSAQLDGFENLLVDINNDVWEEVLPSLTVVEISTDDMEHEAPQQECKSVHSTVEAAAKPRASSTVEPKLIVVHVQYKHASYKNLFLPIPSTATVQQLKSLIMEHDDRLSSHMVLSCEGHPILDDDSMTLDKYGIGNETIVSLSTEFEVYLVGSGRTRVGVTIVIFSTVSILRMLIRGFGVSYEHPSEQILTCAGEVLHDAQKLSSYRQLVPGCEIYVNHKPNPARVIPDPQDLVTLSVRRGVSSDKAEIISGLEVPPESTILDLKVLASNRCKMTPFTQLLEVEDKSGSYPRRKKMNDEQTVAEYSLNDSSVLWLTPNPVFDQLGD